MKKTISAILLLGMLFSVTASAFAAGRIPPDIKSDTGARLTIAPEKTYQFKIMSGTKPVVTVGNSTIIKIVSDKFFGSAYYFTIKAVGKQGQSAGVYLNGARITVCTIEGKTSQLPNPLVSYSTLDEARKAVGFSFAVPTVLPADYQRTDIIVIDNNLAEIFYKKGTQEIRYRTTRGNADISGNYTAYDEVKTVAVGSSKVTMKGKNGLVNLAIWSKDGISYSIDFDEACDRNTVSSMIEDVK